MNASIVERFETGELAPIEHSKLAEIVEAGSVEKVNLYGAEGGWTVVVAYNGRERVLAAERSKQLRVFKRLDSVAAYLSDLGIMSLVVLNMAAYKQTQVKTRARPDRAEAMKHAHQAATYVDWAIAATQASIDDPRPRLSNDEAQAKFLAHRKKVIARLNNKKSN